MTLSIDFSLKGDVTKGDVTRDDLHRRFLAQHNIATLLRRCFELLQHCSNIAMLCCAKITVAHKGPYALSHNIFQIIKYAFQIMHNTFQILRNTF